MTYLYENVDIKCSAPNMFLE